jgi:hypothetical protein
MSWTLQCLGFGDRTWPVLCDRSSPTFTHPKRSLTLEVRSLCNVIEQRHVQLNERNCVH